MLDLIKEIGVSKLVGYVIAILALVQLFVIFFLERKKIIEDLRGKDLKWQFLELSGIAWLVLFPTVVICDLLGVHMDAFAWASMDFIYAAGIAGKGHAKLIEMKYGNHQKESAPSNNSSGSGIATDS